MKVTRTPLALLAVAAFTTAFAGDARSMPAHQATACQEAQCTMDMVKVVREVTAPTTTGSWYLPTWEEANAATRGAVACDEAQRPMTPSAAKTTTTSSWYLPTSEEAAGTATDAMACCKTACAMDRADQAKPTRDENPADSWYLPS